jgi:hypothetical protein
VTCPGCDHAAAYHAERPRDLVSLFGVVRCSRAYYYCRRCGRGTCPFDQQAGVTPRHLTPAVEQLATLAGGIESFEGGVNVLRQMAGVRLSESTVERATEDAGRRIAELMGQGFLFGLALVWGWRKDARGRTVAYVTIDATGTRQQGPGGASAEGRMAYVAGVYNPPPPDWLCPSGPAPPMQARYVSGLYSLAEVGPLLRRQAAHVGMGKAEVWVALTDGGNGLEEFVQMNFNRADLVVILDFFHAASYLEKLSKALHPGDEEKAKDQAARWCRLLKQEGGATTLEVLRQGQWPARKSALLSEAWREVEGYFSKNVHRMEYPEYLAEGWQIGSGVVESACKTVVSQRLKGAGMRWGQDGAHALCHVRALYRSGQQQWNAFWKRDFVKRADVQQRS